MTLVKFWLGLLQVKLRYRIRPCLCMNIRNLNKLTSYSSLVRIISRDEFIHSQSVKTGSLSAPCSLRSPGNLSCRNWNCYQKQKLIIGCFDAPLDRDRSKSNRKGIVCSKKTWHQKELGVSTGRACFVPSLRRCHAYRFRHDMIVQQQS